MSIKTD